MERTRYCLIGDSSLYTKRPNKKKNYVSSVLRERFCMTNLTELVVPGGGVKEMVGALQRCKEDFDVLGVSYFGNEHAEVAMNRSTEKEHYEIWSIFFNLIRKKVRRHGRIIFFIGGFSAKYPGIGPQYDENMDTVRRWVRQAGFQVETAPQQVERWELSNDDLHFSKDFLPEIAEFWHDMLVPRKFVQPGKRLRSAAPELGVKRARKVSEPGLQPSISPVKRAKAARCPWMEDQMTSFQRAEALERAARLERDKKKLNDELALRRTKMLIARGLHVAAGG